MNQPICELQYTFLVNLIESYKRNNSYMTIKQALYRMNVLNQYVAQFRVMEYKEWDYMTIKE